MKIYKDITQKSEEWLELRLGKLTASKASIICVNGVGLQTLVAEKVAEQITGESDGQDYLSYDMERGIALEENARNFYELEKEVKVEQVGFIEDDNGLVGFSPDGLVGDDGLIEIKAVNNTNFVKIKVASETENISNPKSNLHKLLKQYFAQVQMQLLVSKRKWCDLIIFNENFDESAIIFRFEPDEKVFEKLNKGIESGIALIKEYRKFFPVKELENQEYVNKHQS